MDIERQSQQQQQQQEQEEIPLNTIRSVGEGGEGTSVEPIRDTTADRRKVRQIFNRYDLDRDGRINVGELRRLIRDGRCKDLSPRLVEGIVKKADEDEDGHLSFEEFYKLSLTNRMFFEDIMSVYVFSLVPKREPYEPGDEVDGGMRDEVSFMPPPLTMLVFSIVEVMTFVADVIYVNKVAQESNRAESITNGPCARQLIFNPYRRYEAWRFATYMFVHAGVMHIVMNLFFQIFLGIALEVVHRWWRVAIIYVAGVVAGSIGTSVTTPHIFLAGASGGVYALITAHVATLILNWKEMKTAIIQCLVFVIFIGYDMGTSIYRHVTDPNDRVGYMAHLSGGIAGLLVGIGVLRNLNVRRWEKILWWIAITVYVALMATGILINIFYKSHYPSPKY